jgi:NAD(P)H-quinone oxidoreductase subunit 5
MQGIFEKLFIFDLSPFNFLILTLIILVNIVVAMYARNYLRGDKNYKNFFVKLVLLFFSLCILMCSDNLWFFYTFWVISNALLVLLMIHKSNWEQAKASGILALQKFSIGFILLFVVFIFLSQVSSSSSIKQIFDHISSTPFPQINLYGLEIPVLSMLIIMLIITAMIQSAIFPFSTWLLSSLNSPTPVSALMHAGLINGGGILIIKFLPMLLLLHWSLDLLFLIGSITALLATSYMLVQTKVKNKFASSTIGQMGFMFMEIGLGLISAAVTHIIMHGFFKAFLFLNSGSAVQKLENKSFDKSSFFQTFCFALMAGIVSLLLFCSMTVFSFDFKDTSTVYSFFVLFALIQFYFSFFKTNSSIKSKLLAVVFGLMFTVFYALVINFMDSLLSHSFPDILSEMKFIHYFVMSVFIFYKLILGLFYFTDERHGQLGTSMYKTKNFLYMFLVKISQPNKKTVTSIRSQYNYGVSYD